jgi:hypothetical protein
MIDDFKSGHWYTSKKLFLAEIKYGIITNNYAQWNMIIGMNDQV